MKKVIVIPALILLTIFSLSAEEGQWLSLSSEVSPPHRQGHIWLGNEPLLYVFGGNDGARIIVDFWIYNTETTEWISRSLPREITFPNSAEGALLNNTLVIVGDIPTPVSTEETYEETGRLDTLITCDLTREMWTQETLPLAPPEVIGYSLVAVNDHQAMLFGGSFLKNGKWKKNREIWLLDITEKSWNLHSKGTEDSEFSRGAMASDGNGRVLLFGGENPDGSLLTETRIYTIESDRWDVLATENSPSPRDGSTLCSLGGERFLLFGGTTPEGQLLNDTWILDLKSSKWIEKLPTQAPTARYLSGLVKTKTMNGVWLFGGGDGEYLYNDLWIYTEK